MNGQIRKLRATAGVLVLALLSVAQAIQAGEPEVRHWTIDGVERKALVFTPQGASSNSCPVIFAFHGHSGTAERAAKMFDYQDRWPEAIVVYMQGLNTPGRLVDPEGKRPGWQSAPGDQGDRDLKFFDEVLGSLKKDYRVDPKRIYCTGHSNGGGFTYLLWAQRGDVFAAVAPCACVSSFGKSLEHTNGIAHRDFTPKPVLHLAGENDPLVKFAWQKATMNQLRQLDHCDAGQPWGEYCTLYPSTNGTPVVTYIHPGGHAYPKEASATIVKFFQENPKR